MNKDQNTNDTSDWEPREARLAMLRRARELWNEDQPGTAWHEEAREHYLIRAALEQGRRSAETVVCTVAPMETSAGTDYFVHLRMGDREITPRMSKIEGRAQYEVDEWKWFFGQGEKPFCLDYDTDTLAAVSSEPAPNEYVWSDIDSAPRNKHVIVVSKRFPQPHEAMLYPNGWHTWGVSGTYRDDPYLWTDLPATPKKPAEGAVGPRYKAVKEALVKKGLHHSSELSKARAAFELWTVGRDIIRTTLLDAFETGFYQGLPHKSATLPNAMNARTAFDAWANIRDTTKTSLRDAFEAGYEYELPSCDDAMISLKDTAALGMVSPSVDLIEKAFEIGFSWRSQLIGQSLEDSRAIGRTMTSYLFDDINLDLSEFPSFESSDAGIVKGKALIVKALRELALKSGSNHVRLQKLEWSNDNLPSAKCIFGNYVINWRYRHVELLIGYGNSFTTSLGRIELDKDATVEDLKNAAQADYGSRLFSGLISSRALSDNGSYEAALRWIYENGFRHSSDCPEFVNVAFNDAYAPVRAAAKGDLDNGC